MNNNRSRFRLGKLEPLLLTMVLMLFAGGVRVNAQQAERLTLKQAVAKALQSSHELSLAQLRVQVSQRALGVRHSQFLPNLYAGSGIAYTNGFPLAAGGGAPALFSLSYQQALLDPAARTEVRVAEQDVEQQRLEAEKVRDTIIVRVASSYLELAKVRREQDLLHSEEQSAQKILEFTRQRMEAGFELPIEVTRAQLTSARIAQRTAHLEGQEDMLTEQLRTLLGFAAGQRIDVTPEDLPTAAGTAVDELVSQALSSSVDLKQAEAERAASAARLQGERRSYLPTVSLIGQYNVLAHFNNYDQFFSKFQRNNFLLGLDVRIPIFSSRHSAGVSLAQVDLQAAEMTLANKRIELSADVRQKARQSRELQMGGEVARLELELAQQNLQVLQSQYQEGRTSLRDMEAAQLEENDKWLAFLDADFARQKAQLDLLQSTGQVAQLAQ